MSVSPDKQPIPDALKQYVRDPLAEEFTVEIFEDPNAVLDNYLIDLARQQESTAADESILSEWGATNKADIEDSRIRTRDMFGALLPFDFIAANVKMEYLVARGHEAFQGQQVPEDVVEVMQEFLEIVTYRDELER